MIGARSVFVRCKDPACIFNAPTNPFDSMVPMVRARNVAGCFAAGHKMVIGGEKQAIDTFARLMYLYLPPTIQAKVNPSAARS